MLIQESCIFLFCLDGQSHRSFLVLMSSSKLDSKVEVAHNVFDL